MYGLTGKILSCTRTEQELPPEAFTFKNDPERVSDGIPMFEVKFDVRE